MSGGSSREGWNIQELASVKKVDSRGRWTWLMMMRTRARRGESRRIEVDGGGGEVEAELPVLGRGGLGGPTLGVFTQYRILCNHKQTTFLACLSFYGSNVGS